MRFSVCLDSGRPWVDLLELAGHCEATGWDGLWLSDHFMPHHPAGSPMSGDVLEAWTLLTALAVKTSRVRLGTLVLGNAYRHPAVVANMAASLDHVSGGRLTLGVGAGWQPNEHVALGLPLLPVRQRLKRLEEACTVITILLRQQRSNYVGNYYTLSDAPCEPRPSQPLLPLLVGGGGERCTLKIAARYADQWHAWGTSQELTHKNRILDKHCGDVGRDPACILRLAGGELDTDFPPGRTLLEVVAHRDAGAGEFVVRDHRARTPTETRRVLDRFVAEVAELR